MTTLDPLSNALSQIKNAEMRGRREVIVWPASKLTARVLEVMKREGYIGDYEYVDDGRWGKFKVQLLGRINSCGAIKPRTSISYRELVKLPEHYRKYLASRDIGLLILSTDKGVMTHKEAIERKTGGVLIAFVY